MQGEHRDDQPLPRPLWEALRRDEPDAREIERAYRRFVAAPRLLVPPRLLLARWLFGGFALGWGVVFAATGDPWFGARVRATPDVPASDAATAPTSRRAPPSRTRAPATALPENVPEPPPAASSPALPPSAPDAARGVSHHELSAVAASTRASGPAVDPTWQRAAAALRVHDYDGAEAALSDLERGGSGSDRDAASLALAEVLLARGRTAAARARLERLSAGASTTVTRDKARALLGAPSPSPDRSIGALPVTQ